MNGMIIAVSALAAMIFSALIGKWLIPVLKRLGARQTLSEYVQSFSKEKQHTPCMGGIMFIAASVIVAAVMIGVASVMKTAFSDTELQRLGAGIVMILCFTAIGFLDDYIKVVKKRNLGLTEIQKTLLQIVIAAAYLLTLYLMGDHTTSLQIPFSSFRLELGIFYYPVVAIAIYGFVNAVNLTDGVDGLCGTVTAVACVFFAFASVLLAKYGHAIYAAALGGALVGFLMWNFHPAKVFMGDTGSMFLGSSFVVLAFALNMPLIMLPVGIIYLIEAMSVVIQVTYFKLTHGKRIFKMTPIHHHFELSGWSEYKIVTVFSGITAVAAVATGAWLYIIFG